MSGYVLSEDFTVPIVEVVYRPHVRLSKRPAISSFRSAGYIFLQTWDKSSIKEELRIRIMLLSRRYEVLGIYEAAGGYEEILADPQRLIIAALRTNACAIAIARNASTGKLAPNKSDEALLKKAKEVTRLFNIDIWDYVIVSAKSFQSYRQDGRLGDSLINDGLVHEPEPIKIDVLKKTAKEIDISGLTSEDDVQSESAVTDGVHHLVNYLARLPSLLKGPVRHLKIMSATRGYTVQNDLFQDVYQHTSRIYLIGDWIAKTGLHCHDRIKVIPMHRLLIIAPEDKKE